MFFFPAAVLRNQTLRDRMNAEWESIAPISFLLPRENTVQATRTLRREYLHDRPLRNDAESGTALGLLYQDAIESVPVHRFKKKLSCFSHVVE